MVGMFQPALTSPLLTANQSFPGPAKTWYSMLACAAQPPRFPGGWEEKYQDFCPAELTDSESTFIFPTNQGILHRKLFIQIFKTFFCHHGTRDMDGFVLYFQKYLFIFFDVWGFEASQNNELNCPLPDNENCARNNLDWSVLPCLLTSYFRAASVVRGYFLTLSRTLAGREQSRELSGSQAARLQPALRNRKLDWGFPGNYYCLVSVVGQTCYHIIQPPRAQIKHRVEVWLTFLKMINSLFLLCMIFSTICVGRDNTKLLINRWRSSSAHFGR